MCNSKTSKILIFLACFLIPTTAENIIFPNDNAIFNVVTEYGVDNTGTKDVTDTLNAIIQIAGGWNVIYFPNGTYLVSGTLQFPTYKTHGANRGPVFQGQSMDGTIFRLKDGTWPQKSEERQAVIETGDGVAQCFQRGLHNFTVNIGKNNAGATGVYYFGNNESICADIKIISEDLQGTRGLHTGYGEAGPALYRNIHIIGFDVGIYNYALNVATGMDIILEKQNKLGIETHNHPFFIDGLKSTNDVTVIRNYKTGKLMVINADLKGIGGASSKPAIINELNGKAFLRDVKTTGYSRAILSTSGSSAPNTANIEEYSSHGVQKLEKSSPDVSMRLPMKRPPYIEWEQDKSKWGSMDDFTTNCLVKGSDGSCAIKTTVPLMKAFRKALDSAGITSLVIPPNPLTLKEDLIINGPIERIVGTAATIHGPGHIIIEDGPNASKAVKIQRYRGTKIIQRSSRPLILEAFMGEIVVEGPGDVFVMDMVGSIHVKHPQGKIWVWQYNSECCSEWDPNNREGLFVENGSAWVCGFKSESAGTKIHGYGGNIEVMGFSEYCTSWNPKVFKVNPNIPMIVANNTNISVAMASQTNLASRFFEVLVKEVNGTKTQEFRANANNGGKHDMGLYTSYDPEEIKLNVSPNKSLIYSDIPSLSFENDRIVIKNITTESTFEILNIQGRRLYSGKAMKDNSALKIAHFAPGTYILSINSKTGKHTKAFTINN